MGGHRAEVESDDPLLTSAQLGVVRPEAYSEASPLDAGADQRPDARQG
jgi:hypothetical protein